MHFVSSVTNFTRMDFELQKMNPTDSEVWKLAKNAFGEVARLNSRHYFAPYIRGIIQLY